MLSLNEVLTIASTLTTSSKAGGMRCELYFGDNGCFLLSSTNTLMLYFQDVRPHPGQVKFFIDDYEEGSVEMDGDSVKFTSIHNGFQRVKSVGAPKGDFAAFRQQWIAWVDRKGESGAQFYLGDSVLSAIDENLSHIEFAAKAGHLYLVQRDIYSGSVINITDGPSLFQIEVPNFEKMAIRTPDFIALFIVAKTLMFEHFTEYTLFGTDDNRIRGLIAHCVYDDMMEISAVGAPVVPIRSQLGTFVATTTVVGADKPVGAKPLALRPPHPIVTKTAAPVQVSVSNSSGLIVGPKQFSSQPVTKATTCVRKATVGAPPVTPSETTVTRRFPKG